MVAKIKSFIVFFVNLANKIFVRMVPTNEKTALFISFHGKGYSDSPKAIFEQMKKDPRCEGFKFVWVLKNKEPIEGAKVVRYLGLRYFFYLARAKYWVFNCKMPSYVFKKKDQIYLQTWHGTPLKRLGHDIFVPKDTTFYRSGMSFEAMCKTYDDDAAKYDYMVSPNHFSTEVFQSAFRVRPEVLIETGYPRNDVIVNADSEIISQVKAKFHIPSDKKVILYAPTWRDNSYSAAGYTFELKVDFHLWKKYLGDKYVVLFKPHYLIVNHFKEDDGLKDFVIHVPAEADISELYPASDVLVTDYSSVFFDYTVLKRPVYFYMYDLEEYKDELRGFYLDIYEDLPGAIYEDEEKMLSDMAGQLFDANRLRAFNQRFNEFHTGDSSAKVVDILLNGKRHED